MLQPSDLCPWINCRYNTIMKIVFLATSGAIIYFMRFHKGIKLTYDREQDTFRYLFLIGPCLLLALLTTHDYAPLEVGGGWG